MFLNIILLSTMIHNIMIFSIIILSKMAIIIINALSMLTMNI
jgi:hypothetical protein